MKPRPHIPFGLVFSGGGARGFCHVGVLRALEYYGLRPTAIAGVSMGAIVGTTYALNSNWYRALVEMDTSGFPAPPKAASDDLRARIRALLASERLLQDMLLGWGAGARSQKWGQTVLDRLTLGKNLEDGRIRIATVATDLCLGERVVFRTGNAARAAYASAALAGLLPPLALGERLLADGCYTDLVPVDVAGGADVKVVLAVDPAQDIDPRPPRNGVGAMLKATEICSQAHARLRFNEADLVLHPKFPVSVHTLEFGLKRVCIAAGVRAVRSSLESLRHLLDAR